jgi:8-oxo-dGTP pyrophosphatase MutT (NUDIX family)
MAYHKIYDSWSWLGGHADGDEDLLAVATKEVQEESGIQQVKPILPDIFSLEILTVDGHEKNGNYVPSHLHLNITYLLMADDHAFLRCKPDENKDVDWFPIETAIAQSSEPWFRERIYAKLNRKLLAILPELKHLEH